MAVNRSRFSVESGPSESRLAIEHKVLEAMCTGHESDNSEVSKFNDTGIDAATERQRIDSLSTHSKAARPPSYLDETDCHEVYRTGSVGGARARPPSIIEAQEKSDQQEASKSSSDVRPTRSRKRRIKATDKDTNGQTDVKCTVTENQNKADSGSNPSQKPERLRHDSSSESESTYQSGSGGSVSSYEAEPEFPSPQEVSGPHQSL